MSDEQSPASEQSGNSVRPGKRNWIIYALVASLALNLLIIGMVIGARLSDPGPRIGLLDNPAFTVGRAIRGFEKPRQSELWDLARPHFRGMRKELRSMRRIQRRWESAYTADPIDMEELNRAHESLQAHVQAIQSMNFDAIRSLGAELSAQERSEMLEALRKPFRHRPRGPHHKRHNYHSPPSEDRTED